MDATALNPFSDTTAFDPFFNRRCELTADGAVNKLTVVASEPVVLVPAGSRSTTAGYRLQEVPTTGDLFVNGDIVCIEGTLKLPGRAVQINARVLEVAGDTHGIDVSGNPGATPETHVPQMDKAHTGSDGRWDHNNFSKNTLTAPIVGTPGSPGKDGDPGKPGLNAGWIDLRAGTLRWYLPPPAKEQEKAAAVANVNLTLRAVGGTGGTGQDGQPGQPGGNGGKGIDAHHGYFEDNPGTNGADAGAGGPGGRGGPAGNGGNGGTVRVLIQGKLRPDAIKSDATSVAKGAPGIAGTEAPAGTDGTPGPGGDPCQYNPLTAVSNTETATVSGGKPGSVGAPLPRPDPAAPPVDQSTDGQVTISDSAKFPNLAITVSRDQLAMLLDRTRTDYLGLDNSDLDAVTSITERLDWLLGVSGPDPTFGNSYLYASGPDTIYHSSHTLDFLAGFVADPSLKGINLSAAGLRRNLRNPLLDSFGHTAAWAPLASLKEFDALLRDQSGGGSIKLLKDTEDAWSSYQAASEQANEAQTKQLAAVTMGKTRLDNLQQQKAKAWDQLTELSSEITALVSTVGDAKAAVVAQARSFQANVANHVDLSFDKFLDVIEQTAFAAGDPPAAAVVGASEYASMWKSAVSDVTGDNGETVSKDYLISRLGVMGTDFNTLDEAYDFVDGSIKVNDSDASKLLCTQDKLNDLLDNYRSIPGAKEAEEAMAAFVREVQLRNAKILDYNSTAATLAQLEGESNQVTQDNATLEGDAAKISLPVMDRFVQGLYDRAKQDCITDLYLMSRAYRFWSLNADNVFHDVLSCNGPSTVNCLAVDTGHQSIRTKQVQDIDKMSGDLQPRDEPVVVRFDAKLCPAIISSLKKDRGVDSDGTTRPHFWQFSLDPATKSSTAATNQFHGMANVRLTEVRCWLIGLKSAADLDGNVKVYLTQHGDEQIVPKGALFPVSVTHDPVEKTFEYSTTKGALPSAKAVVTPAILWELIPSGELPEHTPIGPFATWRIGIRTQDAAASNVDWETLQEIRLEFSVKYQSTV